MIILKKIFITGSGSGLGKESAIHLAKRGHTVYASVHYNNQIYDLQQISKSENLKLEAFKLDILNIAEREKILNYDIDTFICNSAIGDSGSAADISITRIKNVFETNIFCNLEMIQLALKNMISKGYGRIIIISSIIRKDSNTIFISILCI